MLYQLSYSRGSALPTGKAGANVALFGLSEKPACLTYF